MTCCCFGAFVKTLQVIVVFSNIIALTARGTLCHVTGSDNLESCTEHYNVRNFLCRRQWSNWPCHEALGLLFPVCATIFSLITVALNCATARKRARRLDACVALINGLLWIVVAMVYYFYISAWWARQSALRPYQYPINWYLAMGASILLSLLYVLEMSTIVASSSFYYDMCCPKSASVFFDSEDGSVIEKDEETNLMQVTLAVPTIKNYRRSNSCNT